MSKARPQPTPQYSYKPQKDFDIPSKKPQYYAPAKETSYGNEKLDKGEVQELKKKVQEINYMMNKRKRSAIKIQKVWRGYLARKRFARIKGKLMQQKMVRVKQQKKKDYIRKNAKKIICQAIYTYVLRKRNQEKELLKRYVNHCATMIQKTFRGAITRIRYRQMRRRMRRFRIILTAFVIGWKTRKIFKDNELISLQQDVKDIENLAIDIADNDDPEAVATKEEIPWRLSRAKRQHADRFWKLYFTGAWADREDSRYRKQSSRRADNDEEPEYYQYKRKGNRGQGNRRRKQSDNEQHYDEEPRRNRDYDRGPSYGEEDYDNPYRQSGTLEERQPNAWDAREDMPIGGKGKYAMPDDMEEPDVGQERSGKKGRNIPYRDERDEAPITGKGSYDIPDDAGEYPPVQPKKRGPARRRDPNAFDAKEDQPVGGKGEYVIPDDLKDEAFQSGGTEEVKAKPKREIVKKAKYDPRKAIEEAKKREEEGGESATKNKKSEAFRDIIKNARKYQQESAGGGQSDKERADSQKPAKRGRAIEKKGQIENGDNANEEEKENLEGEEQSKEDGEKRFKFLKRKTKTIVNEKLNWGKVGSRIDCWVDRSKEAPKSPEREKITITTSAPTRPKTSNPQSHSNQENMKTMNHPERAHGRTERAKSPMVQRVGKNDRHEENVGPAKETGPIEIKNEQKKKKPAPATKGRGTHPNQRIKVEELEKAYNTNFLNKLNHMTQKFYSESGARDPEENYTSLVPILRLNSAFFFRDDMEQYHEILAELNEEYQSLQIIN